MVPVCSDCRRPVKPSYLNRHKNFTCRCGCLYLAVPHDWEEAMYLVERDGKLVFKRPFRMPDFLDWLEVVPV